MADTSDAVRVLESTKEFSGLDRAEVEEVARAMKEERVEEGQRVLAEGETQGRLVIVGEGVVLKRDKRGVGHIDDLEGPVVCGMLHVFRADPVYADVTVWRKKGGDASQPLRVYVLEKEALLGLLRRPSAGLAVHLLGSLSERLRAQSKWMRSRMEGGQGVKVVVFDAKEYDKAAFEPLISTLNEKGRALQGGGQFVPEKNQLLHFEWFPRRLSMETVASAAGATAVCIFVNDVCDKTVLEELARYRVKMILLRCAGYNNVDLAAAEALGISVVRVPAYSPYAVAEFAVALTLTLVRKLHRAVQRTQHGNFALNGLTGIDLHGKTVGVIGTGKIGQCTVAIFRGFGCRILAYDAFPNKDWAAKNEVEYLSLDEMLPQCDVVSLHCPLLPETHHLLNADRIGKMKRGAFLINTSRGPIVDTAALIAALKQDHLAGAGLDVYENEREYFFEDRSSAVLDDDLLTRLTSMPNVVITSHQAFLTREALHEIAAVTLNNLTDKMWLNKDSANVVRNEYSKL